MDAIQKDCAERVCREIDRRCAFASAMNVNRVVLSLAVLLDRTVMHAVMSHLSKCDGLEVIMKGDVLTIYMVDYAARPIT